MAADEAPPSDRRSSVSNARTSARASRSPLRQRLLSRASTVADPGSPLGNRRGSSMTESVDDARQSFKSSTDDLLLPRVKSSGLETHHEPSHWHSAPLALALLPAVGGLFFNNGSAVVTDITLLLLAAVFLNWSVRIPWDWYCSAQRIRLLDSHASDDFYPGNNDTIIEEESEGEVGNKEAAQGSDPVQLPPSASKSRQTDVHHDAESELRWHELTALFACFISPMIGAWLLHAIRGQLSRPSEGLVSNYNLTIFLLGAELRPLSHLIKMVQSRTLHLQRTLNSNPYEEEKIDKEKVQDLGKRLDELEAHIADTSAALPSNGHSSASNTGQVSTEVRKSLQPELDALNRAVRRYEKRATILTMQTEARLQDLEARMADAITLAAAAERSTSQQKQGSAGILLDWICAAVVLPAQTAWSVMSLPAKVAARMLEVLEGYLGRKVRVELRTAGRTGRAVGPRPSGRAGKKL
ncbi:hypothetical protein MMC26_002360 [Xylographa opegraphella]|nr:hypothetical protein [Xylographa opegraphella]